MCSKGSRAAGHTPCLPPQLWIALLIYRHGRLAGEVWWRFALFGAAPRSLRAAVGAPVVVLLVALVRLLSLHAPDPAQEERPLTP